MGMFRGQISGFFAHPKNGLILMLTNIEGNPRVGMQVLVNAKPAIITELGQNSTDGQPVSTRSCLTGQPCPPYGLIVVEIDGAKPANKTWVEEVRSL